MNVRYTILLLVYVTCIHGFLIFDATSSHLYLYGQVIYPYGSPISIEPGSRLVVELHDISVTNVFSLKIAEETRKAVAFPIVFSIRYNPNHIVRGHLHVLNVRVVNKRDEILFVNEKRIEVKLLGKGRTTFIDVPVIRMIHHDAVPYFKLREWPKLVGMKGEEAAAIIKQETGFAEVFVVTEHSKLSKDIRYDRVCIFVGKDGKVLHVPRTG